MCRLVTTQVASAASRPAVVERPADRSLANEQDRHGRVRTSLHEQRLVRTGLCWCRHLTPSSTSNVISLDRRRTRLLRHSTWTKAIPACRANSARGMWAQLSSVWLSASLPGFAREKYGGRFLQPGVAPTSA